MPNSLMSDGATGDPSDGATGDPSKADPKL
jgi:hypothetical protein